MSINITKPQQEIDKIISFLKKTYLNQNIENGVIAVSGGIDSALSLTLLTKALGPKNIFPLLLPYEDQSIEDGILICNWNKIPKNNIKVFNIESNVELISKKLSINESDNYRKGNIMARTRMIFVFDYAKKIHGLVSGTENKSEKYLGYFTRFGDEASDIEPIEHLYKTQIFELSNFLEIPNQILKKEPSAGLWKNQTDENELGFSYEDADKVIEDFINNQKIYSKGIPQKTQTSILNRIKQNQFKFHVPYILK